MYELNWFQGHITMYPITSSTAWSGGLCATSRYGKYTPFTKIDLIPIDI